jgi:hypothetical protein
LRTPRPDLWIIFANDHVDGSIWVISGGVNPTSTIQALALYIADNIKQRDTVRLN